MFRRFRLTLPIPRAGSFVIDAGQPQAHRVRQCNTTAEKTDWGTLNVRPTW